MTDNVIRTLALGLVGRALAEAIEAVLLVCLLGEALVAAGAVIRAL